VVRWAFGASIAVVLAAAWACGGSNPDGSAGNPGDANDGDVAANAPDTGAEAGNESLCARI
jgi:hypothetical protein